MILINIIIYTEYYYCIMAYYCIQIVSNLKLHYYYLHFVQRKYCYF